MKAISIEKVSELLTTLKLNDANESWLSLTSRPEGFGDLATEDVLEIILSNECNAKSQRKQTMLLQMACLPPVNASIQGIIFNENRCGDFRKTVMFLSTLGFVKSRNNITIFGGTGTGKSYIATALIHECCVHGYKCRFWQASDLMAYLASVVGTPAYARRRAMIQRFDVLGIDDFCLTEYTPTEQEVLYDILNDRYGRSSTIVTSQKSPDVWRNHLGGSSIAEAIVERIASNNYNLILSGDSMRTQLSLPSDKQ